MVGKRRSPRLAAVLVPSNPERPPGPGNGFANPAAKPPVKKG